MKSRPVILLSLALGAAALCALAALWPRPEPEPPAAQPAPAPERLRLEHRLADVDAVLVRSASGYQSRRMAAPEPRLSVMGGTPGEAASHTVRLEKVTAETGSPDGPIWRREASDCGGTLYAGGWILTAAHCVEGRWEYVEAWVEQSGRAGPARARYRLGEAAVHRYYEGCGEADGDDACRHDVALLKLPDDPGGGLPWPQSAQTELEAGERVRTCGFGLTEAGRTSDVLRCYETSVVWARAGVARLDESGPANFMPGDSGSGVFRAATGTQIGVVSHIAGGRRFVMTFPAAWGRGVRGAWD